MQSLQEKVSWQKFNILDLFESAAFLITIVHIYEKILRMID